MFVKNPITGRYIKVGGAVFKKLGARVKRLKRFANKPPPKRPRAAKRPRRPKRPRQAKRPRAAKRPRRPKQPRKPRAINPCINSPTHSPCYKTNPPAHKMITSAKSRGEDCFVRESIQFCCRSGCFGGYPLTKFLGMGESGTVYLTCVKHKCRYAIKIVPLNHPIPRSDCGPRKRKKCPRETLAKFKKEVAFIRKMSKANVGPKYIDTGVTTGVRRDSLKKTMKAAWVVSEAWGSDLEDYFTKHAVALDKQKAKVIKMIKNLALKVLKEGLFLDDLHSGNIVVKVENTNIVDLRFIDYGYMRKKRKSDSAFSMMCLLHDPRCAVFNKADIIKYGR